ncbi:hypothetical protein AAZV13_05G167750 [Glycine max]
MNSSSTRSTFMAKAIGNPFPKQQACFDVAKVADSDGRITRDPMSRKGNSLKKNLTSSFTSIAYLETRMNTNQVLYGLKWLEVYPEEQITRSRTTGKATSSVTSLP